MRRYIEYLEAISGDRKKERELKTVVEDALEEIKKYCPDVFYRTVFKMHCIAYGPHFDGELAKMAVSKMKNVDGTSGEHWSMEQTNSVAEQHGIKYTADFYYVMNMLYSDFGKVFNDAGTYAKLAKAYMEDPDAPEGKVFYLWLAQMQAKES